MHGIIYAELKKYIDSKFRNGTWDFLLEQSGIGPKKFLLSQEYPDSDALSIVTAASKLNGNDVNATLEGFGQFLAPELLKMYHLLIKPSWKTLDIIEHTEETIHKIVRMRNPGAQPPRLKCIRRNPDEIIIRYASPRKMCSLLRGLVQGLAKHFCDQVIIQEISCAHSNGTECTVSVKKVG